MGESPREFEPRRYQMFYYRVVVLSIQDSVVLKCRFAPNKRHGLVFFEIRRMHTTCLNSQTIQGISRVLNLRNLNLIRAISHAGIHKSALAIFHHISLEKSIGT
jgi:hypothetical protein